LFCYKPANESFCCAKKNNGTQMPQIRRIFTDTDFSYWLEDSYPKLLLATHGLILLRSIGIWGRAMLTPVMIAALLIIHQAALQV
jgi:hypothetical protein